MARSLYAPKQVLSFRSAKRVRGENTKSIECDAKRYVRGFHLHDGGRVRYIRAINARTDFEKVPLTEVERRLGRGVTDGVRSRYR